MSDDHDLDLQVLHRAHETDPAFRAALRARVVEVLTTHTGASEGEITMLVEDRETEAPPQRGGPRRAVLWGAAAAVVALVAGTIVVAGVGDDGEGEVDLADATPVFDDGFDEAGGWPTNPQPGFEVTTGGGRQVIELGPGGLQIIQAPAVAFGPAFADMVVAADVISVSDGSGVGVHCRKDPVNGEGSFYAFRLGPDGAQIVTNKGMATKALVADPEIAVPSGAFSMAIRCVDGDDGTVDIRAFVDGAEVLATTDDQGEVVEEGVAAVEVMAGPDGAEVTLDRLVVSRASKED